LEQILLLIIGIFYFAEKATKTKIFVITISFTGAIIVMRPDLFDFTHSISKFTNGFNVYYVFIFLAISFWALNSTVIKVLGKTEKTKVQLFYVMLFSSILAFPVAFMHWEVLTSVAGLDIKYPNKFIALAELGFKIHHLKYILVLALCYLLHVVGHFKALKHAEISFVVPFEYTRLVFAGIFGYLMFGEVPVYMSYVGYLLIISAGLIMFRAERRRLKRYELQRDDSEY
jgi:S-adenosylmethionine uptake transporter